MLQGSGSKCGRPAPGFPMIHPLSGAENIADRGQGELALPELVPEWAVEQREADPV